MEEENDETQPEYSSDNIPMVTPIETQSENDSLNEDLSSASMDDLSPVLSNNSPEWVNEEDNMEESSQQSEVIPIEDTLKKNKLEDNIQDFMYLNLEEVSEEEVSAGHSFHSLKSEERLREVIEEARIRYNSLEVLEKEEPGTSEMVVPKALRSDIHKYAEKTHTWLEEEFPNLVKMFPVHAHYNSPCEKMIPEDFEEKIKNWVETSMIIQKHGIKIEKPTEKCEIEYYSELKEDSDEVLRKDVSVMHSSTPQAVTVKFLINDVRTFTCAFDIYTHLKDVKETLSRTFRCEPVDLELIRKGIALSDNLEILELGVEPYGTVEIEIKVKGSIQLESMYEVPLVPDVITVRVESATEEVRDVVVEIESRCMIKPFVGGYRHKKTGVEYHHAFSQTPSLYFNPSAEGKRSRDTQTAEWKEMLQNTTYDVSTQMCKSDYYVPSNEDKILSSRPYVTALELQIRANLDAKAIVIQRWWRRILMKRKWAEALKGLRAYREWEREKRLQAERDRDMRLRKEIVRKIFPRTRADYEMLYAMVENWRKAEIKRISSMKTDAPKKAEFCLVLQKEVESLNTIEKFRLELIREKKSKKEMDILEKCATPVTWIGYKGKEVSMETVHIQRAKELKELYHIMCQEDVTAKERIELLISLKYALKSYNPMMTNELISLFERECNCLLRGVKPKDLCLLRQRTQKLFIELMKDPEFNPESTKHLVYNLKGQEGKMHFCQRCQRLKAYNEFAIFAKSDKLEICNSCTWLDEIGRSRIDLEPYRFMIRSLRRDERRRKCFSSVAFIMQDKDFYNLIVNIWHCRSLVSEETDVYKLCLGRWDITRDWTPWNCVLLTEIEMIAHLNLENVEEAYSDHLVADIGYKHRLAECQFSHLYKFDQKYVGSEKWFARTATRHHKVVTQDSSDT